MLVLTVSYDGTGFAGSQVQPGERTVQGELERALGELRFGTTRTTFASRTDQGVHAAGQIVSCEDARPWMAPMAMQRAINAHLPPDLAVVEVRRSRDDFHPRYDAHWREYRYRILSGERAPLARSMLWHRRRHLDLDRMAAAADLFEGRQDFAAVAGGGDGVPWATSQLGPRGTVRTVIRCECRTLTPWWGPAPGTLIELRIRADGFLPRMVRNIAGILAEVGAERLGPEAVGAILQSRDRRAAPRTAPAHGLTLWGVGYLDGTRSPAAAGEHQVAGPLSAKQHVAEC